MQTLERNREITTGRELQQFQCKGVIGVILQHLRHQLLAEVPGVFKQRRKKEPRREHPRERILNVFTRRFESSDRLQD